MNNHELKKHRIGDLIRNDSAYGDGETGIVIEVKTRAHGEYDMLVQWNGSHKPQWHSIDPYAKWYLKILARGQTRISP
jgi:hypothetical protein